MAALSKDSDGISKLRMAENAARATVQRAREKRAKLIKDAETDAMKEIEKIKSENEIKLKEYAQKRSQQQSSGDVYQLQANMKQMESQYEKNKEELSELLQYHVTTVSI